MCLFGLPAWGNHHHPSLSLSLPLSPPTPTTPTPISMMLTPACVSLSVSLRRAPPTYHHQLSISTNPSLPSAHTKNLFLVTCKPTHSFQPFLCVSARSLISGRIAKKKRLRQLFRPNELTHLPPYQLLTLLTDRYSTWHIENSPCPHVIFNCTTHFLKVFIVIFIKPSQNHHFTFSVVKVTQRTKLLVFENSCLM